MVKTLERTARPCRHGRRPGRLAAAAAGLATLPSAAAAHGAIPGIEGFYVGLLHPFTTPGQLLALLALGAMLGQAAGGNPAGKSGRAWAAFALAAVAGILVGLAQPARFPPEPPLLVLAAVAATLAALLPAGFPPATLALCVGAGVLLGLASLPDPGPPLALAVTLAGSFVGANLALLYATGTVAWLRSRLDRRWARTGLRIVAAWIAAISTLMAALAIAAR